MNGERQLLTLFVASLVQGCGAAGLGDRISYELSEVPHPLATGEAGSCMPSVFMGSADLGGYKWAIGARLEVLVDWPDRTDCTSSLQGRSNCASVRFELRPMNPSVWVPSLAGVSTVADVVMQAVGPGSGGFAVMADGHLFESELLLTTEAPSEIRFARARGPAQADDTAPALTELRLNTGEDATIAVTLRSASGEHLCGPVAAVLKQAGTSFAVERLSDTDFVNLPYHIVAGPAGGEGALTFEVGALQAELKVVVLP